MTTLPSILQPHDPGVMPWVIVAAYGVAVVACLRTWRVEQRGMRDVADPTSPDGIAPRFWLVVAVILIMLGANKQLDLHVWITQLGRQIAWSEGWYRSRRAVQLLFVTTIGLLAAIGFIVSAWRLRRAIRRYALALIGVWTLGLYVGLRAVSFHHADAWFGIRVRGLKLHWIIELAGVTTILMAAIWADPWKLWRTAAPQKNTCSR